MLAYANSCNFTLLLEGGPVHSLLPAYTLPFLSRDSSLPNSNQELFKLQTNFSGLLSSPK